MDKKIRIKPSKTESKMSFVFGPLFSALGFFVVIPVFGLFGVLGRQ